ncbi:MAG TPA: mechanosensitive ion channel family protein [Polyangiaceae bacterium]
MWPTVTLERWTWALLGIAIVFVAFLVNRYAPTRRHALKRLVLLWGAYLFTHLISLGFDAMKLPAWSDGAHGIGSILKAIIVVGLASTVVWDVLLPALKHEVVSITRDVTTGVAYIIATVIAMHGAGMNLSSVIATSAVVSGILAISLQTTLGNILGGFALQLDGSIHVGDWIMLDNGKQGKVREITWRHTVVETRDWDTIVVPNANLLSSQFTILGKRSGMPLQHRMWVYFNVDFRYSPQRVIEVVNEALQAAPIERIALDPAPHAICYDFAKDGRDSFAYYAVRYWLTDLAVDDPTNSVVRTRIHAALKRAGIPLARPASTMFMVPDDATEEERRNARHFSKRLDAIKGMSLFEKLTPEEQEFLAEHLLAAPFTAGETITREGAVAHWLYILRSGRAKICAKVEGVQKTITEIEAPDFFGEMGMMTGEQRTASVIALTDCDCFRLDKAGFQKIITDRPEIAAQISETLAQRRVELIAVREGLDEDAKKARKLTEQQRILGKVQSFFGLSS